mmetsp:Transcript_7039/g.6178  ORF Transcript_7039/g.6178 Transcript_7039/m.6178 type:complete len:86 (-) Transcript_7039:173-430(-)
MSVKSSQGFSGKRDESALEAAVVQSHEQNYQEMKARDQLNHLSFLYKRRRRSKDVFTSGKSLNYSSTNIYTGMSGHENRRILGRP